MKFYKICLQVIFTMMLITSCNKRPESLLKEAKSKFSAGRISYKTEAHFPIPDTKLVNKMFYDTELSFNESEDLGYQFIQKSNDKDIMYKNGEINIIYHQNKKTQIVLPKHFESKNQFTNVADRQFIYKKWSPLGLLKRQWNFVKDTILQNVAHKAYSRVVFDSIVDGISRRTEQHILVNSDALLTHFERRNYNDGALSQKLTFLYSDYRIIDNSKELSYKTPENYTTQFGITKKKLKKVAIGDKVPFFNGLSMDGDSINNSNFKNKKYLLNFSVINCGNCKLSLDYMNQEGYSYNSEIPMVYINPEDNAKKMRIYMEDIKVPFPVITEAKEIADNFGVNSYPRFFLVNEEGIIEDIQIGYSKDFLDKFKL